MFRAEGTISDLGCYNTHLYGHSYGVTIKTGDCAPALGALLLPTPMIYVYTVTN